MASPKYTLRRVGATATQAQGIALANALRPFFVGPPGTGGGASYTHTQSVASASWTVNHMLGYRPAAVTVLSVGGQEVGAGITHISVNQLVATFDFPELGQVLCS